MPFFGFYALFFIVSFIPPLLLLGRLSIRNYKKSDTKECVNCIILIVFESIKLFFILFYFKAFDYFNDPFMPYFFLVILIFITGTWILIIISSIIHHRSRNNDSISTSPINSTNDTDKSSRIKADLKRKINHIIFFLLLWIGLAIFNIFLQFPSEWNQQIYLANMWEYVPDENFMIFVILKDPTKIYNIGIYHSFFIVVFTIASYLMMIIELIRHFDWFYFPTIKVIAKVIRPSEEQGIASFYSFLTAITIVFFILPPLLTIGAVIICLIGDLVASQVGMRFGKNKISFNKKKSWEGTISATIASFLLSTILIGPIYSIFGVLVFLITDILTEEKIPLSDNLLNPILIMLMYILINLCGIYYTFPRFLIPFAFR